MLGTLESSDLEMFGSPTYPNKPNQLALNEAAASLTFLSKIGMNAKKCNFL